MTLFVRSIISMHTMLKLGVIRYESYDPGNLKNQSCEIKFQGIFGVLDSYSMCNFKGEKKL